MSKPLKPSEAQLLLTNSRRASARLAADSYALCGFIYRLAIATVRKDGAVIPLFRSRGFGSWPELVDAACGVNAADAGRMRSVWQVFEVDLKGRWNRNLTLPSWRKMYLVSRMADRANVNWLLERGRTRTVRDMEQDVRTLIAKLRDPNDVLPGPYNFHGVLTDRDKIECVKQAIERFSIEHNTHSHGEFLFGMSFNYLQSQKRRKAA
jgi:hypothetical protein